MNEQIRQLVLKRDSHNCRNCHINDHLEVHHIFSEEECDLMGGVDEQLRRLLEV